MSGTSEGTVSSPSVVQIWLIPKQHGEAISRNYKTSMKITLLSFCDLLYNTSIIRLELLKLFIKSFWRNFFQKHWKKRKTSNLFEVSTICGDSNIVLHSKEPSPGTNSSLIILELHSTKQTNWTTRQSLPSRRT